MTDTMKQKITVLFLLFCAAHFSLPNCQLSIVNCQFSTLRAQTFDADYKMAGPYEVVARDGEFRASKGGSERDMRAAWELAKAGHHEKACEIINAYADKLQRLDGHDAPLCLIQGYWLCRAMMEEKPLSNSPRGGERGEGPCLHGPPCSAAPSSLP